MWVLFEDSSDAAAMRARVPLISLGSSVVIVVEILHPAPHSRESPSQELALPSVEDWCDIDGQVLKETVESLCDSIYRPLDPPVSLAILGDEDVPSEVVIGNHPVY